MIIEKFSILDFKNCKAAQFNFGPKSNIFCSSDNKDGKSSVLKSLYYALGYEIATFPNGWNFNDMRFRLDVRINNKSHIIMRQNNTFFVDNLENAIDLNGYTEWLQEILNIKMKLKRKNQKDLSKVYASQYLLPFYVDQDKSWNGFLYKGSDTSSGAYSDVPKRLFEYLFGFSNDNIINIQIKKQELEGIKSKIDNQFELLISLENKFINDQKSSSVPESYSLFKEDLDLYLKEINRLAEIISISKEKIINIEKSRNKLSAASREKIQLIQLIEKEYKNIQYICTQCDSILTLEQSTKRLRLNNNKYELEEELQGIYSKLRIEDNKYKEALENAKNIEEEYNKSIALFNNKKRIKDIEEYIEFKKNHMISFEYNKIKDDLISESGELGISIKSLDKEINSIKRELKRKQNIIESHYSKANAELKYILKDDIIDKIDFLNFTQIKGSGTSANITMLGLYLIYSELISKYSRVKLPLGMDSFIKNELDTKNGKLMFDAMIKYFINLDHQTFFSVIEQNYEKFMHDIEQKDIVVHKIQKPVLTKEKYDVLTDYFG